MNDFDRWLEASYKYYITYEDTGMSDAQYDQLSRRLLDSWDLWKHPYKHLTSQEDLNCGSGYRIRKDQYPAYIVNPPPVRKKRILVYGSNLAGRSGAGSAKYAVDYHRARYGVGTGRTGDAYAIPTKDEHLRVLPLEKIAGYIDDFLMYASSHPELEFDIVAIGCGLAGYTPKQIAPFFEDAPINCHFINHWNQVSPP